MPNREKIIEHVRNWVPLSDRIVVLPVEKEKETSSGLQRTDVRIGEDNNQFGKVLAVGKGRISEYGGTMIPMEIQEGDTVMFSRHAGDKIFMDEEGQIYPGLGDKREEWLAVVIVRQEAAILYQRSDAIS